MRNKLNPNQIIEKAKEIYGDFYIFSKMNYTGYHSNFIIICPKHGEFQKDYVHFITRRQGCPKCSFEKSKEELNNQILAEEYNNKNFKEEYDKLIENAKKENRSKGKNYYELHHIIPKSLGGSNNKENLVLLTAEEHFRAHYLLWKFTETLEMQKALWVMIINSDVKKKKLTFEELGKLRIEANRKNNKAKTKEKKNRKIPIYCLELDKTFESAKEAAIFLGNEKYSSNILAVCRKEAKAFFEYENGLRYHWCKESEKEEFIKNKEALLYEESHKNEIRGKNISKAKKGNPVFSRRGKCYLSEESKKRIGEKNKNNKFWLNKHLSEETKKKISEARKGSISSFKGKQHSEETKKKIKQARSKAIKCIETDKIYSSCKEALLDLNVANKTNSSVIAKAAKSNKLCYGFHWSFVIS